MNSLVFVSDNISFGRKVTSSNVRRLIRKIEWSKGTKYEMYRHDYSLTNPSPITNSSRLYDANYYVMNSEFKVYICIDNGSSGINTTGNASLDEPTFTDLEPSKAGVSGDGYIWKYLFTVAPSDIIKFDSTDFIALDNNWSTSTNAEWRPNCSRSRWASASRRVLRATRARPGRGWTRRTSRVGSNWIRKPRSLRRGPLTRRPSRRRSSPRRVPCGGRPGWWFDS